ncbi:MAG: hypothetical protein M3290_05275, partial [Actinomycetota bacterium]|nr:hypothetical protein [Actinomycetota bacterium]
MEKIGLVRRGPALAIAVAIVCGLAGPALAKDPVVPSPAGLVARTSAAGIDLSWQSEVWAVGTQSQYFT